jgi:GPI ethanolamine phosphate transferase 1
MEVTGSEQADMNIVISLSVPFLHTLQPNSKYLHRLMIIFLTFAPIFIILTISYEGLFYFAFCVTMVSWVQLEHRVYSLAVLTPAKPVTGVNSAPGSRSAVTPNPGFRALTMSDFRIAVFFYFLIQSAFFSTGNIASISSFSLDSVYRLIPVFDPFSQGALLVLKLLIPFAVISANLGILNRLLNLKEGAIFTLVSMIGEYAALGFFFRVRDEGSWLDIGSSISNFVIASLLGVFCAALEGGSGLLVRGVEVGDEQGVEPAGNGYAAATAGGFPGTQTSDRKGETALFGTDST